MQDSQAPSTLDGSDIVTPPLEQTFEGPDVTDEQLDAVDAMHDAEDAAQDEALKALEVAADDAAADTALDDVQQPLPSADPVETRVKCAKCGTGAKWSGELDRTATDVFTRGFHEETGLPNCPHCGTAMEPVELLTAEQAITAAAKQLADEELARQDADRAGNAARPVYQPSIPGLHPPFDFRRALMQTESLERNVAAAEDAWDQAKEEASSCKKTFDAAVEQLRKHIQSMHHARVDAEYQARRADTEATSEASPAARQATPCLYERTTGKPCPICTRASEALPSARSEATAHVAHAISVGAIDQAIAADDMVAALRAVLGLVVPVEQLVPWAPDDYKAVGAYLQAFALALEGDADTSKLERPAALGRAHQSTDDSRCRVCGALMYQVAVAAGMPDGFPAGQLVGIDCAGEPENEPARPPKPRHAKKTDRQRAKQAAAKPWRDGYPKRMAKASVKSGAKKGRR